MPDKPVAQETPAVKRRKGPILILVAALLLLAGGGAAAWVLMKPAAPGNEAGDSAPVRAKKHASLFVPLDPFTVNLADEGGERMAQIAVTLEVANGALTGRMVLPLVHGEYQRERFDRIKGQCDLVLRDGKWFLYATVDVPEAGRCRHRGIRSGPI